MSKNLYEGTKQVLAHPMTRGAYLALRCWDLPPNESAADEGYLIEYVDGGAANVPGYDGYISWSPKDVFERAYKPVPYTELPPHQQRVMLEAEELTERLNKLHAFRSSEIFKALDPAEKARLERQGILMAGYLSVLIERTKAF